MSQIYNICSISASEPLRIGMPRVADADAIAPSLIAMDVTRTGSAAVITFTSDAAGQYYYAVDVDYLTTAGLVTLGSNQTELTAGEQTIDLAGLSDDAHTVFLAAKDGRGGISNLLTMEIPSIIPPNPDTTPPVLTVTRGTRGYSYANISTTASEPGVLHYLVVESGAQPPTAEEVMAGRSATLSLSVT